MKNLEARFVAKALDKLDSGLSTRWSRVVVITVTFAISRLFYYFLIGVRFDAAHTLDRNNQMQLIDYPLLKSNFFQSIYYLHSQPPLYNIIVGGALNLFPHDTNFVLDVFFVAFGWAFTISLYHLMHWLGAGRKISFFMMLWFILSPSSILYENFLYTSYLEAGFLCISAMFLFRFLQKPTTLNGLGFFGFSGSMVLLRSSFHLFWFVLWLLVLLYYYRRHWRKIALTASIPFLLVFSLYIKNYYTFGIFTTSSWVGINLSRISIDTMGQADRQYLADKVPPIAWVGSFASPDGYQKFLSPTPKTGIPALDEVNKQSNPAYPFDGTILNFNNLTYVEASKQVLNADLQVILKRPQAYIEGVATAFLMYCWPSNDYAFLKQGDNSVALFNIEKFYDTIFYGQYFTTLNYTYDNPTPIKFDLQEKTFSEYFYPYINQIGFILLFGLPLLFFYGFRLIKRAFSAKPRNLPYLLTLCFIWINIIYVTLTSNFLELGENQRFRFTVDAFFVILLALFIQSRIDNHNNKKEKGGKTLVDNELSEIVG